MKSGFLYVEGLCGEEGKMFHEGYYFHIYSLYWKQESGWDSRRIGWDSLAEGTLDKLPELSSHLGSTIYARREGARHTLPPALASVSSHKIVMIVMR